MSGLPFELLLALRYLRPKRTFVSVITLISVIGVTLGVAVLIIVISVMSGFGQQIRETILGFHSHMRIQTQKPMEDFETPLRLIAANPEVKGVSPYVIGPVLAETQSSDGSAIRWAPYIRGIDASLETNVSVLPRSVKWGTYDVSGKGALVGSVLADAMHLNIGDRLTVFSPKDLQKMKESLEKGEKEAILPKDFTVRGIFDVGYYEFNAQFVVISLENAQDLYELEGTVHGLFVTLKDPYRASRVRDDLRRSLGGDFRIGIWTEENAAILAVLVEKNVMLYILFFIVLVAAFGITCTLITFVVLKTREIGMLKALGASSRQVMWIFLSQSLLVSVMGVLAGLGLGLLALVYRNEFLHFMRNLTGIELFPASIYGFTELPALIVPADIAIICGGSLIICLLAAAFPVWNASRLKPVEALRHE